MMSTVKCEARTWVSPDEMVVCDRGAGHLLRHVGDSKDGRIAWDEARVFSPLFSSDDESDWTASRARVLVASLQSQLAALDPNLAVAEAEKGGGT